MSFPRFRDDTMDPDQFQDPVTDPPFSTPYIYSVFLPIVRSGSSVESDRQQRDLVELETQVNAVLVFFTRRFHSKSGVVFALCSFV